MIEVIRNYSAAMRGKARDAGRQPPYDNLDVTSSPDEITRAIERVDEVFTALPSFEGARTDGTELRFFLADDAALDLCLDDGPDRWASRFVTAEPTDAGPLDGEPLHSDRASAATRSAIRACSERGEVSFGADGAAVSG